jgi:hypothetical protein
MLCYVQVSLNNVFADRRGHWGVFLVTRFAIDQDISKSMHTSLHEYSQKPRLGLDLDDVMPLLQAARRRSHALHTKRNQATRTGPWTELGGPPTKTSGPASSIDGTGSPILRWKATAQLK